MTSFWFNECQLWLHLTLLLLKLICGIFKAFSSIKHLSFFQSIPVCVGTLAGWLGHSFFAMGPHFKIQQLPQNILFPFLRKVHYICCLSWVGVKINIFLLLNNDWPIIDGDKFMWSSVEVPRWMLNTLRDHFPTQPKARPFCLWKYPCQNWEPFSTSVCLSVPCIFYFLTFYRLLQRFLMSCSIDILFSFFLSLSLCLSFQ